MFGYIVIKNMELYGTEGSLYVPDPIFFGEELELIGPDGTARDLDEFAELRFLNLIGYVLYFIRKLLRNSAILAAAIIGSIIIFVVFAFIVAPENDLLRA